ncbi:hypothetical protein [Streptantibioticus ferralitis]|uniref:Uncharacterized protein n=1 Tax=Streptantibioticus ferralitis TaxID=236510 RepID=A0ABT5Z501_9ACTN|nr:hypothetical protein [Streptantibioticus ferralitis]MDF2258906.1 hypothetical protein [Streptantibioticus ferralitis]
MIGISGLAYALGSRIISNADLAISHGLEPDYFVSRTGIEHRLQRGGRTSSPCQPAP